MTVGDEPDGEAAAPRLPRIPSSADESLDEDTETAIVDGSTPIWRPRRAADEGAAASPRGKGDEGPTNVLTAEQTARMRAAALRRARLEHSETAMSVAPEEVASVRERYREKIAASRRSATSNAQPRPAKRRRAILAVVISLALAVSIAIFLMRRGGW